MTLRLGHAAQHTAIREMQLDASAMDHLAADLRRFPAVDRAAIDWRGQLPLLDGGATLLEYLERNLRAVLASLRIDCPMIRSSSLGLDPALRGQERILAIARRMGASRYLNAPGGRDLYEADAFAHAGIRLEFLEPATGNPASLLERLCSEGPEAIRADVR